MMVTVTTSSSLLHCVLYEMPGAVRCRGLAGHDDHYFHCANSLPIPIYQHSDLNINSRN